MPASNASPQELLYRQQLADAQKSDADGSGEDGGEGGPNAEPEQNEGGEQAETGGPNDMMEGADRAPESWVQRTQRQLLMKMQQGEMTDAQMGGNAKKLWKMYEKKMEDLRFDLAMEMDPMSTFFFPIGIMGYGLTDVLALFDGGTLTTIVNWIVYIITAFVIIYRIKRYATLRYRNVQRQIRRTQKLMQRAMWRVVLRLLVSLFEAIPFVGLLPIWSFVHQLEHYFEKQDILKLQDIERMRADVEKRLKRVWTNAQRRGGMNALQVAMAAIKMVQMLDKKYDEV